VLGMAVLQKNDPDQAAKLEPYFDGVLDEQCNQYAECSSYQPYLAAGKPIAGPPPTTGSPSPSPSSGRAVDKVAPKIRIGRGGLEARSDVVAVSLSCPRGQSYCARRLELVTEARFAVSRPSHRGRVRAPLVIGSGRFHILGGRSALVKVKLSEPVLRKLGRRNPIRVRVQVTARDAAERRGQATLATVPNLRRSPAGQR
jgi:hypothetical protein